MNVFTLHKHTWIYVHNTNEWHDVNSFTTPDYCIVCISASYIRLQGGSVDPDDWVQVAKSVLPTWWRSIANPLLLFFRGRANHIYDTFTFVQNIYNEDINRHWQYWCNNHENPYEFIFTLMPIYYHPFCEFQALITYSHSDYYYMCQQVIAP